MQRSNNFLSWIGLKPQKNSSSFFFPSEIGCRPRTCRCEEHSQRRTRGCEGRWWWWVPFPLPTLLLWPCPSWRISHPPPTHHWFHFIMCQGSHSLGFVRGRPWWRWVRSVLPGTPTPTPIGHSMKFSHKSMNYIDRLKRERAKKTLDNHHSSFHPLLQLKLDGIVENYLGKRWSRCSFTVIYHHLPFYSHVDALFSLFFFLVARISNSLWHGPSFRHHFPLGCHW